MYLTEEEARNKVCPQRIDKTMEYSEEKQFGSNQYIGYFYENCIASECMMWRWKRIYKPLPTNGNEPLGYQADGDVGYCGLGGKP
jgi:hypothetical protein